LEIEKEEKTLILAYQVSDAFIEATTGKLLLLDEISSDVEVIS
jgi:hypothetical protein